MEDEQKAQKISSNASVCGHNGRNGRRSKKPKLEKIPQRGLGVAQLEQERLEKAQQKTEAVDLQIPVITPQTPSIPQRPSQPRPYHQLYTDRVYGHIPGNSQLDVGHHGIVPVGRAPPNGCQASLCTTDCNGNNISSPGYIRYPCDGPNGMKAYPCLMQQRTKQSSFNPPSAVNAGGAAKSSPDVLDIPIEPPSNQSLDGTYQFVQPDDTEKIVGLKRQCQFLLQDEPDNLPQYNFNPFGVPNFEISTSFENPGSYPTNENRIIREGTQNLQLQQRKVIKTDCFPATTCLLPNSNSNPALYYELHSVPSQVHAQGSYSQGGLNIYTLHHQQGTPNNVICGQSIILSSHNNNNGETEDKVDLNNNSVTEEKVDLDLKL